MAGESKIAQDHETIRSWTGEAGSSPEVLGHMAGSGEAGTTGNYFPGYEREKLLESVSDPYRSLRYRRAVQALLDLSERSLVVLRHSRPSSSSLSWVSGRCLMFNRRYYPEHYLRIAVLPGGTRMALDIRDDWHRGIYYRGEYEPETTRIVRKLLRPGDVFFDIGANAGYYACLAAGMGARVHAFEPNSELIPYLCRSCELNGYQQRMVINPIAVTESDGWVEFHLSPQQGNTGLSSMLALQSLQTGRTLRVRGMSLDTYCRIHNLDSIKLIKLDVEGGEISVLRGAERTLREVRPEAIICEVGGFESEGYRPGDVVELLRDAGYVPARLTDAGMECRDDGEPPMLDLRREYGQYNLCFVHRTSCHNL